MSAIEDFMSQHYAGENSVSYEQKWNDFVMFSVIHLLKVIIGKTDNPNVIFKSLIGQWEERQDSGFEKQIKELQEKLDDKTDIVISI